MSERDELRVRLLGLGGSISAGWRGLDVADQFDQEKAEAVVDATMEVILAAGYRKPRTITTAEEVYELSEGAVVIDSAGDVSQLRHGAWCSYETSAMTPRRLAKYLPATVLHEGAQS